MSTAICKSCAKGVSLRMPRGSRLSDVRCQCGGHLTIAAWSPHGGPNGGFVARSSANDQLIGAVWQAHGLTWDGYAKKESFGKENY